MPEQSNRRKKSNDRDLQKGIEREIIKRRGVEEDRLTETNVWKVEMSQDTKRQVQNTELWMEIRYKNEGKDTKRRSITRKRKNTTGIPDFEIDSIARAMIPAIQKLFESEEIQKEFEEWKAARQKEKNKTTLSKDDNKDAETDNLTIKT